jgi:hypothetical protein
MKDFPGALPHGPLTRVADGVHLVRGTYKMGPGVVINRTMTVLEGPDGLVILNPIRLDEAGESALAKLGAVKHLVKISDSHRLDDPYYVSRFAPTFWTLPGADIGSLTSSRTLGPDSPIPGATVVSYGKTAGWLEAAYLTPLGGGTLVTCDAVQNHVDTEGLSLMAKLVTPLLGFKGGVIVPKMWRKYHKVAGAAVRDTLAALEPLPFENLVAGHGPAVVGGASARVRDAIAKVSR